MQSKILGSAAGGGFPQWNCACPNCHTLRQGTFRGKARSQTQVAISPDGRSWFLLGASPDLRAQIESTPELHARDGLRQSPIAGAILANADIDHVLGLLLLRELQPLRVYSTGSVCRILREDNSMFGMLNRVANQIVWHDIEAGTQFEMRSAEGEDSGLRCRAWSLSEHYPAYVAGNRRSQLTPGEASLGLMISSSGGADALVRPARSEVGRPRTGASGVPSSTSSRGTPSEASTGKILAYFPAVPEITGELLAEINACDLLLFDGTFWSDDELIRIQGSGQTARQMGHVPVETTLTMLAEVRRPRKIFLHINNTNPMLDEASPQYRQVRGAGWEVAEDGWQFDL